MSVSFGEVDFKKVESLFWGTASMKLARDLDWAPVVLILQVLFPETYIL